MDFVQRYRELRLAGHSRDVALGVIRREGANFLQSMKVLYNVEGFSVGDAKTVVHTSPAWADEHDERETFWEEVGRCLEAGVRRS